MKQSLVFSTAVLGALAQDSWVRQGRSLWDNTNDWEDTWGTCGEENWQSPIDIDTSDKDETISKSNTYLPDLDWFGPETGTVSLENNGLHIKLNTQGWTAGVRKGGLLHCDYYLDHFDIYAYGSNHEVNDDRSTGEFIMKLFKDDECTHGGATPTLAISILTERGSTNDAYKPIVDRISQISSYGSTSSQFTFDIGPVTPKYFLKHYYIYEGSSMVPPCDEATLWMICRYKEYLSNSQYDALRTVRGYDGQTLKDNYRSPVKIGARAAYRSWKVSKSSGFGGMFGGLFFG